MSHIATALFAAFVATALIGGSGFAAPAEAAPMTAADKAAQKKTTADCKAQVREGEVRGNVVVRAAQGGEELRQGNARRASLD